MAENGEMTPAAFISSVPWRTAKTMPEQPHEYVNWWQLDADGRAAFEWFRTYVRKHGYLEHYGRRSNRYLEPGDGFRYWASYRIINRARLGADVERAKAYAATRDADAE